MNEMDSLIRSLPIEQLFAISTALFGALSAYLAWAASRASSRLEKVLRDHEVTREELEQFLQQMNAVEEGTVKVKDLINSSANNVAEAIRDLSAPDRKEVVSILASPSNKARRAFLEEKLIIKTS